MIHIKLIFQGVVSVTAEIVLALKLLFRLPMEERVTLGGWITKFTFLFVLISYPDTLVAVENILLLVSL